MAYPSTATGFASISAVNASSFVNSIGVNAHLNYLDTAYGNIQAVGDALTYLGVDRIRDWLPDYYKAPYDLLASRGVQFDFYFPGNGDLAAYVKTLAGFEKSHPGSIAAIEGGNEVNYWPVAQAGGTSLASQAAFQKALFNAINADPTLKNIPVFNLTLGGVGDTAFKQLGDMSASADYANVHIYYGAGGAPATTWSYALGLGQIPMPGAPSAISETGYSTAVNNAQNQGVDEVTQAKYMLDLLMDAAKAGIKVTEIYELVDQKNDPGKTSKENNFGLFHNDWTPKIAATAIHNFTTILTDGVGDMATGGSLAYNVTGLPKGGSHLLFQEGNGVQDIVVWAEPDIWDEANRRAITVTGQQVTITLPTAVAGYAIYDPMKGATAITTGGPTSTITLTVTDHPLIIEIKPEGSTTTTAPAPELLKAPVSDVANLPPALTAGGADGLVTGMTPTDYVAGGMSHNGGSINSTLIGGAASDTMRGNDGNDTLSGGGAYDVLTGDNGNDTMSGGAGGDFMSGGANNDLMRGDDGNDIVYGNAGQDTIDGGAGNDTLRGGLDADTISGGLGNDWIAGDKGADTISGGGGADTFHFFTGGGVDRITDFSSASGDRVQLDSGAAYTLKFVGADTVVDMGNGDQVILVGVGQSALGDWLTA